MNIVAVLHNIRSLHNVGSFFRTADAAGVRKLYLCGITGAPVDCFGNFRPQISKVALGAEKYIPWEKIGVALRSREILKCIDRLKKEGYAIVAVEQTKNSISFNEFYPSQKQNKLALVLGNEVRGLPRSILSRADYIVEIPMHGKKQSLNVSVAFGVVAYALNGKRVRGKRG